MFIVGDKVLYPMHGAGVIERIEEKEALGEFRQYYIMNLPFGGMSVMIPAIENSTVGLRSVVCSDEAKKVLSAFGVAVIEENTNWNHRYRDNLERLKKGDIYEVSGVVYSLMKRDKEKGLSTGERKMLISARQILISELSLSGDLCKTEIEEHLDNAISKVV